jgi:hypothetical protein
MRANASETSQLAMAAGDPPNSIGYKYATRKMMHNAAIVASVEISRMEGRFDVGAKMVTDPDAKADLAAKIKAARDALDDLLKATQFEFGYAEETRYY